MICIYLLLSSSQWSWNMDWKCWHLIFRTALCTCIGVPLTVIVKSLLFCNQIFRTIEWLHCKLQTRPLVREGAPKKQDRKFQTAAFWQELISGRKSHRGARYGNLVLQIRGNLKLVTTECGHESRRTQTWEGLRWEGPAATINYRKFLSSERAPHNKKPSTV
jgi:hypothetical protein